MIKRSDHVMYSEQTMMAPPAAPILGDADPTVSFVTHFMPDISMSSNWIEGKGILYSSPTEDGRWTSGEHL